MSNSSLLGRCKSCDFALFATEEDVMEAESFREVKPGRACRVGNDGFFSRCHNGHKIFILRRIKGTYSPDHKCDARCLNAKGHHCTCSCGGANHGRGFATTVTAASEGSFIGEVGKRIVGNVTVVGLRLLDKSTLYTFSTDKGDIIKWFAPSYAATFEEGESFKLRARVKRHEDGQYGKSTIVIYAVKVSTEEN